MSRIQESKILFVKRPSQTLVVVEASYVRLEAQDWAHINIYIYSWQTALLQEIRTFGACCQSSPCTGLICLQLCALQVFLKSDVCHRLFTGVFATAFPESDKPPLLRTHGSGIAKGNLIHTSSRLSTKKNRHAAMVCFESRFLTTVLHLLSQCEGLLHDAWCMLW